MSNITSPVPSKPSDCDTEEWNSLAAAIFPDEGGGDANIRTIDCEKLSTEYFDIENMDIVLANSRSVNTSTDNIQEGIDAALETSAIPNSDALFAEEIVVSEVQITDFMSINVEAVTSSDGLVGEMEPDLNESGRKNEQVETAPEEKSPTRKRKRVPSKWKQNVQRDKRQHGECYINSKGKLQKRKDVKDTACHSSKCYFKCAIKITPDERKQIHQYFWTLSDQRKSHFYSKHVKRSLAKRKRTDKETSKKTYSYEYFFEVKGIRVRVCQNYFLNTLDISKRRIYYFFDNIQQKNVNEPRELLSGKHKKRVISDDRKNEVLLHIESFPAVDSHYCRSTSKKKYLERDLNITKMYNLYLSTSDNPVSFQSYSDIFNYEYNISFFKPKKDLCDKCEEFKLIKMPTEKQIFDNEEHLRRKKIGKEERDRDRIRCKNKCEGSTCVVTYDLQNVFSLPKAYVGGYYYKSKLNTYNLTGHCSMNNCVYNAMWHEYICGRGGTHLASALIKILKAVVNDIPNLTKIILWSDSCVPQNRNSILSFALQHFLNSDESKNLESIEHKYSEPGHGTIQEIDCAHSCIERYIKHLEIWSPLTLIRILTHMPTKWKMQFRILQMIPSDYLNYHKTSATLSYNLIPYARVKQLIYEKQFIFNIKYRESFESEFDVIKLSYMKKTRGAKENPNVQLLGFPQEISALSELNVGISEVKKKALEEMLPQMPDNEKIFYQVLLSKQTTYNNTSKQQTSSTTKKAKISKKMKQTIDTTKNANKKKRAKKQQI